VNADLISVRNFILIGFMAYVFIFLSDRILKRFGAERFTVS